MDLEQEESLVRRLAFEALLDGSREASEQLVEISTLRRLCARGVPDQPRHLRPLAYSLLLETLPPAKRAWRVASRRQRERYYALVRQFMEDLEATPKPSYPLTPHDDLISAIVTEIDKLQSANPLLRTRGATLRSSPLGPPTSDSPTTAQPPTLDDDGSSSSVTSSEDEATSRAKEDKPLKGKRRQVERLVCRRAVFIRADTIAKSEHNRKADKRTSTTEPRKVDEGALKSNDDLRSTGIETGEYVSNPEINLSPRITLSSSESEDQFRPLSFDTSNLGSERLHSLRPAKLALSVSPEGSGSSSTSPSSPITLVSPKPIPAPGQSPNSFLSGSLLQPDTHAEILTRVMYIFCRAHPHITFSTTLVDILHPLYLIYCGIDLPHRPLRIKGRRRYTESEETLPYAEEQTFWAFTSLMSERTTMGLPDIPEELRGALSKLDSRIRWADGAFARFLRTNNLDPFTTSYPSHWWSSMFTRLLPGSALPRLWEFILSEKPTDAESQPRADAMIDIAAALVLASKDAISRAPTSNITVPPPNFRPTKPGSAGLWGESGLEDPEPEWTDPSERQAIYERGLNMFTTYPLVDVGGLEVVMRVATQIRDARLIADLTGDDPDGFWNQSNGMTSSSSWTWLADKARNVNIGAGSASRLSKYVSTKSNGHVNGQDEETSSMKSTPSLSSLLPLASAQSAIGSIGGVASRFFSKATTTATPQQHDSSPPSTPRSHRHQLPMTAGFSPPITKHPSIEAVMSSSRERGRSDTVSSSMSVASLQERLASLGSAFSPRLSTGRPSSLQTSPLPRPLLLSNSARRTSGSSIGKRDSSPIMLPRSAPGTPPTIPLSAPANGFGGPLSPPSQYGRNSPSPGLYRISSARGPLRPIPSPHESPTGSDRSHPHHPGLEPSPAMAFIVFATRSKLSIQSTRWAKSSRTMVPALALGVGHTLCQIRQSSSTPLYPGHVPLSFAQNALLAVGSGIMGVMDTSRGDLIATLSESTASTFLPRLHNTMVSHAEGRQIMRDRPLVSSSTVNLEALKALRRGTLGREYVEWLEKQNVTPDTREVVRYIDSPTLAYTMTRYRQTHDLYHTLFSLPTTLPHELTLKVVELSNMSLPVAALSSLFGPLRLSSQRREVWKRDWVPWALRTGANGRSLVSVYWEKRWEQGVGDLRRELGVKRNDKDGVESRWKGYRVVRGMERELRRKGEWVDEPEEW